MEDRGGEYRAKGSAKPDFSNSAPLIEFRRECRAFAEHWIEVQRDEFERLGVVGDWDHHYTTMDFPAEAQIARELMKFAANGTLYRGTKPVMWSVVEKTALAEAEVEYEDYTSDTVWVKFPMRQASSGNDPGRHDAGQVAKVSRKAICVEVVNCDLDNHALDHPGQSRDQLLAEDRIRPL